LLTIFAEEKGIEFFLVGEGLKNLKGLHVDANLWS